MSNVAMADPDASNVNVSNRYRLDALGDGDRQTYKVHRGDMEVVLT